MRLKRFLNLPVREAPPPQPCRVNQMHSPFELDSRFGRWAVVGILGLTVLVYCVLVFGYSAVNSFPAGKDAIWHLYNLERFVEIFQNEPLGHIYESMQELRLKEDFRYPPLWYLTALPIRLAAGRITNRFQAALAANYFFVLIFVIAFYHLMRIAANRTLSVLATIAGLTWPSLFLYTAQFTPVVFLAAWTLVYLLVLTRPSVFLYLDDTLALAAVMTIGLLSYYGFLLYTGAATALVAGSLIRHDRVNRPLIAKNLLLFGTVVLLVFLAVVYNPGVKHSLEPGDLFALHTSEGIRGFLSDLLEKTINSSLWYLINSLFPDGLLAAEVMLLLFFQRRAEHRLIRATLVTIASVLFFLAVIRGHSHSYLAPVIPLFYLLGAIALAGRRAWAGIAIMTLMILSQALAINAVIQHVPNRQYKTIKTLTSTITDECRDRTPRCRVVWTDCESLFRDYVFSWNLGQLPKRYWSVTPTELRSIDQVDYFVVNKLNFQRSLQARFGTLARSQYPVTADCPVSATRDLETGHILLGFKGHDVTKRYKRIGGFEDGTEPFLIYGLREPRRGPEPKLRYP